MATLTESAREGTWLVLTCRLKERLFTNKSKRPGDDTKEALRTDGTQHGRLGILLATLFGSHVNQAHHWCFQAEWRFFVPCMPHPGCCRFTHTPSWPPLACSMSSLQDLLTGPKSKVSALGTDTRSYDPPPAQVGEEEQVISPPYTRTRLDASMRDGRRESRVRTMPWLKMQSLMKIWQATTLPSRKIHYCLSRAAPAY